MRPCHFVICLLAVTRQSRSAQCAGPIVAQASDSALAVLRSHDVYGIGRTDVIARAEIVGRRIHGQSVESNGFGPGSP
jgi:hypothetical protein